MRPAAVSYTHLDVYKRQFLLPLDLCVYCAYSSERKYFTPFDEMKVGWVPSVVAIAMVALVIPGVCTLMGLQ